MPMPESRTILAGMQGALADLLGTRAARCPASTRAAHAASPVRAQEAAAGVASASREQPVDPLNNAAILPAAKTRWRRPSTAGEAPGIVSARLVPNRRTDPAPTSIAEIAEPPAAPRVIARPRPLAVVVVRTAQPRLLAVVVVRTAQPHRSVAGLGRPRRSVAEPDQLHHSAAVPAVSAAAVSTVAVVAAEPTEEAAATVVVDGASQQRIPFPRTMMDATREGSCGSHLSRSACS